MSSYNLLIAAVPHNKAELVSDAAVGAGSWGGTVLMGRMISASPVLSVLGLGGATQDIGDKLSFLILRLSGSKEKDACKKERRNFGIMFTLNADTFLKKGIISGGDGSMKDSEARQDLICVIVNKGYADDAMAAARKAGAGGGTVLNARGTAREDDVKFFGMHIVPEKEMLMIVTEHEKKAAVIEAIRTLPCLEQTGSGITFSAGVENFTVLGKN